MSFYSSAFRSKTEKIENFSENSKKSLNTIFNRFVFQSLVMMWGLQAYIATIKTKCCKFVIEFLFLYLFFFQINQLSRKLIIVPLNSFGFSMWSKWSASLTHAKHAFGNTWNRNHFEIILKNLGINHKKQLDKCMHNNIMFHAFLDTKFLKGKQIKGTRSTKGAYHLT